MPGKTQKNLIRNRPKSLSLTMPAETSSLYDKDFYRWATDQSKLLKRKEFSKLDIDNLIEEIESLGRSEKRTLESFFKKLLHHLLKLHYQPDYHTRSWDNSIKMARIEIIECLEENPSLTPKAEEIFRKAYRLARLSAANETGLDEKTFPEECPWSIKECMKNTRLPAEDKKGKKKTSGKKKSSR